MSRDDLYGLAAGLLSEDRESPEYDRGIINLVAELDPVVGQPTDERMVAVELRLRKETD